LAAHAGGRSPATDLETVQAQTVPFEFPLKLAFFFAHGPAPRSDHPGQLPLHLERSLELLQNTLNFLRQSFILAQIEAALFAIAAIHQPTKRAQSPPSIVTPTELHGALAPQQVGVAVDELKHGLPIPVDHGVCGSLWR
jgi:hypothetical protein